MTQQSFTRSELQTAMYVMAGATDSRAKATSDHTEERWSGGHMDMADTCARAAVLAEEVYRDVNAEEWNGCVWLYEVAEELGGWLFEAGEHTNDSEIKAKTIELLLAANSLTELPEQAKQPAIETPETFLVVFTMSVGRKEEDTWLAREGMERAEAAYEACRRSADISSVSLCRVLKSTDYTPA